MQYYKVKIRLAGSTMNEVRKVVSAPELLVLQYVHGVDAVTDVEKSKREDMSPRVEKERLKGLYDQSLVKRDQSIDKIFGALGVIPTELPDDLLNQYDIIDEDDIIAVAKNVTKNAKKNKGERDPVTQEEVDNLDKLVSNDEISLDDIAG